MIVLRVVQNHTFRRDKLGGERPREGRRGWVARPIMAPPGQARAGAVDGRRLPEHP